MPDNSICPHHEKTRELIGDLNTRIALAEQKAQTAEERVDNMENQMKELMIVTTATQKAVNQWGWSFYLFAAACGVVYEFRDPLAKLLGWL